MDKVYKRINHKCLNKDSLDIPPRLNKEPIWYKLKRYWYSWTMISETNPLCIKYFKSDCAIQNEKRRHYYSKNFFIIHPLSKLSAIYNLYMVFLYMVAIFYKIFDSAFIRRLKFNKGEYAEYAHIINIIDMLCWGNILFSIFRGELIPSEHIVLLEFRKIFLYRVRSFSFWVDIISSLPKYMLCTTSRKCLKTEWYVLILFGLFKTLLCFKVYKSLERNMEYLQVKSLTAKTIVKLTYFVTLITHCMTCLTFATPRYRKMFLGAFNPNSWILYDKLLHKRLTLQYGISFFKASAQTFGITIDEFQDYVNWDESVCSMINYILGKIMHLTTWVVLLNVLLTGELQDIRFAEIIAQINNWMDIKDLPVNLKKRVIDYYKFFYRKKYFNKEKIQALLPETLGAKVRINICKSLRESNISIFAHLSEERIQHIAIHLITEIYSPNDVIIYAGSVGDALYLLASGTVAVYSHSGKEVCHLQDGAFFGEMSLVLKDLKSTATIIAVEATKVYRLPKIYFEEYMRSDEKIFQLIREQAERRLRAIKEVEEHYQESLFQEKYSATRNLSKAKI